MMNRRENAGCLGPVVRGTTNHSQLNFFSSVHHSSFIIHHSSFIVFFGHGESETRSAAGFAAARTRVHEDAVAARPSYGARHPRGIAAAAAARLHHSDDGDESAGAQGRGGSEQARARPRVPGGGLGRGGPGASPGPLARELLPGLARRTAAPPGGPRARAGADLSGGGTAGLARRGQNEGGQGERPTRFPSHKGGVD